MVTRRDALKAAAAAGLSTFAPAFAQGKRPLRVNLLGFALGIHVPTTAALLDILPGMGYRSEERRVGKEGRGWGKQYDGNTNDAGRSMPEEFRADADRG